MYKVRVKKFEGKNWKVIAEFDTKEEAKTFAIKLDMEYRKNFETAFDHIDIKYPNNCRFIVA